MGLFDELTVLDAQDDWLTSNYTKLTHFQTKDFHEPMMENYYLHHGRLFRRTERKEKPHQSIDGLLLVQTFELEEFNFKGTAEVYTYDNEILPVLVVSNKGRSLYGSLIEERFPFCRILLTFDNGFLTQSEWIENKTREEFRKELKDSGLDVLDDNDKIAQRHFILREHEKEGF